MRCTHISMPSHQINRPQAAVPDIRKESNWEALHVKHHTANEAGQAAMLQRHQITQRGILAAAAMQRVARRCLSFETSSRRRYPSSSYTRTRTSSLRIALRQVNSVAMDGASHLMQWSEPHPHILRHAMTDQHTHKQAHTRHCDISSCCLSSKHSPSSRLLPPRLAPSSCTQCFTPRMPAPLHKCVHHGSQLGTSSCTHSCCICSSSRGWSLIAMQNTPLLDTGQGLSRAHCWIQSKA